jgi:hypothetical protein
MGGELGQLFRQLNGMAVVATLATSGKTQIDYFAPLILNKTECCTMVQKWNINIHNGDNGPNGA